MTAAWKAAGLTYVARSPDRRSAQLMHNSDERPGIFSLSPPQTRITRANPDAPKTATTATWQLPPVLSAAASRRRRDLLPSAVARWTCASSSGRYVLRKRLCREVPAEEMLMLNTATERQARRGQGSRQGQPCCHG